MVKGWLDDAAMRPPYLTFAQEEPAADHHPDPTRRPGLAEVPALRDKDLIDRVGIRQQQGAVRPEADRCHPTVRF
jgi:hypothetical protein